MEIGFRAWHPGPQPMTNLIEDGAVGTGEGARCGQGGGWRLVEGGGRQRSRDGVGWRGRRRRALAAVAPVAHARPGLARAVGARVDAERRPVGVLFLAHQTAPFDVVSLTGT